MELAAAGSAVQASVTQTFGQKVNQLSAADSERLARFIDPAQRHLDAPSDEAAKTIRLKLNEEVAGEKREVLYVTLDYGDFTWRKTRKMKDVK